MSSQVEVTCSFCTHRHEDYNVYKGSSHKSMASPQKENGYVTIANELAERFSLAGMNGSEHRILWVVIRKTYGYNKKQDYISLTQFQKSTGMGRKQVVETIHALVGKRLLLKEKSIYGLNKDWESWVVGKRLLSGQKTTTLVGKRPPKVVGKSTHTKDRKTTIQKTGGKTPKPPPPTIEKKFMFGEFKNVSLSLIEKEKLKEVYGRGKALEMVEALSAHLESIGKDKYASHYATIRNWARRDKVPENEKPKQPKPTEKEPELTEEEKARNTALRKKISESIKNKFKKP